MIVGIRLDQLLQRCVSMGAARDSEPESGVLTNLLRIVGCGKPIESRIGRDICVFGNRVECALAEVAITIFRHERAQVTDALLWISSGHNRHGHSAGIDCAVGTEKPNAADLFVFYPVQHGNALSLDVITVIARPREVVVF